MSAGIYFYFTCCQTSAKAFAQQKKTVGIRIPNHPIALRIVEEFGSPIISTSTTSRKGDILINPIEIKNVFNSQVDLMLASGNLNGRPSSVINLSEEEPEVIREGAGDVSLFV